MLNQIIFRHSRRLLTLFLLTATVQTYGQRQDDAARKKAVFGINAEITRPLGDFEKNHTIGFGGAVLFGYNIHEETQLTFSAGYLTFRGRTFGDEYLSYKIADWGAVPIRLGAKYFATPHLFLKAETGAAFFVEPGSGTSLILGPGVGIHLHHFEATAKLETWTDGGTVSFAGFSLGYFF